MRNLRATFTGLVLAALALSLLGAPASAAKPGKKPKARNDLAQITGGGKAVAINVLANDRVWRKKKARVRIVSKSSMLKARVVKKGPKKNRIRVSHPNLGLPATYAVKYRVIDAKKRKSTATLRLRITPPPKRGNLVEMVNGLAVQPEGFLPYDFMYNVEHYGPWTGGLVAGDGCDTRGEVFIRESLVPTSKRAGCSLTGEWESYFSGHRSTNMADFEVDHLVPLGEAHASGFFRNIYASPRKSEYANDLGDARTLIVVEKGERRSADFPYDPNNTAGPDNRDPAEWLPTRNVCRYLADWTAVKTRWGLTVDETEKAAMLAAISDHGCENTTVAPVKVA